MGRDGATLGTDSLKSRVAPLWCGWLATLRVSRSKASFHSYVEEAVDPAPFSVAAARVFAAFAASVADAAALSAAFSRHQPSAAPSADVLGPVFVAASAAPALASGTSFLVPFRISDPCVDFRCSAVDPAGSPLANR